MTLNDVMAIVAVALSSGLVTTVVQYTFKRIDEKNGVAKDVKEIKSDFEEYKATQARTHILRFADELHNGVEHSHEYFKQLILDINTYDNYVEKHRDFKNGLTEMASEFIKDEYAKENFTRIRKEEHDEITR